MDIPKLRVYVRASSITSEQNRELRALDFASLKYHKSLKRCDDLFCETDNIDTVLSLATKDIEQSDVFVILTPTPEFIHHSVCIELGVALVRKIPVIILTGNSPPTDKDSLDIYSRIYGVWLCDNGWGCILEKLREIYKQRNFERMLENGEDFRKRQGC